MDFGNLLITLAIVTLVYIVCAYKLMEGDGKNGADSRYNRDD